MQECDIGDRLRYLRESCGMTQDDLSEASGIHRVSIARYETGRNGMSIRNAQKIARALGCTVGELIGETELYEEPEPYDYYS